VFDVKFTHLTFEIDIENGLDFSCLDWHLDWFHFAVKSCKLKCKNIDYFLLTIFIHQGAKKPDEKKTEREQAHFGRIKPPFGRIKLPLC